MDTLTFQTPDEARAWDMYVSAHACGIGLSFGGDRKLIASSADAMILERRKRMAPLEPETFGGSVLTEQERAILDKAWRRL